MPRGSLTRFQPPPLEVDATTRWVLRRSFGPGREPGSAEEPQTTEALRRAGALGVAARIAARASDDTLLLELDEDTFADFRRHSRRALEGALVYDALVDTLAEHAEATATSLVLLKGYALHAGGYAAPGSRTVGDLDILVAGDSVEAFHAALQHNGFAPAPVTANEQHLPPLAAPGWGVVDLHWAMRGVCDPYGTWLDAAAVLDTGEPREVAPGCWVPDPALLAAHAMAHAIEQHASNPRPYPLLRMVCDLQDLLADETAWARHSPEIEARLIRTLGPGEIEGARELTLGLARGEAPEELPDAARELLAHLLAHALDEGYRKSLRGRHLRHRVRQARERGTLLRYAGRKLSDLWRRIAGRR